MSEYEDMTVAELKDLLREAGLTVSGKKADLIARLSENDSQVDDQEEVVEEAEAEVEEHEEEIEEDDDDDFDDDFDDEWDDEEEMHVARQKPKLDDSTKQVKSLRDAQSRKQPAFRRQEWYRYKRLSKTGWRKPKGMQSKQRMNKKYRSPMARVGYGKVAEARGLHPSGFREVMVHNPDDLESIDPSTQAARIGKTVGNRKRAAIHERADALGIRVLNRRRNV